MEMMWMRIELMWYKYSMKMTWMRIELMYEMDVVQALGGNESDVALVQTLNGNDMDED
jgi:hypothetical protein